MKTKQLSSAITNVRIFGTWIFYITALSLGFVYNLDDDPYEQISIADTADPNLVSRLDGWLDALRNCAGASCRVAKDTPP